MSSSSPSAIDDLDSSTASALGRPRTVLDVGCGTGQSGALAVELGAHVVGIEADPERAAEARRRLSDVLAIEPTDRDAVGRALDGRRFDVVLLGGALETAADPAGLLAAYVEHLEPEGRVILSLRNRPSWRWGHPDRPEARTFSRVEATALVEAAGLEVLRVTHGRSADRATRLLVSLSPERLSHQHVVVARRRNAARPLTLTVGMLTMDEEESIERMMHEIRRYAPDADILLVDSSMKDQTPIIAERMGARVIRQLPPRGHGPAMEVLMYEASKQSEALIYLDCDFTYPPELIPQIRKILEGGVDVVNAARTRSRPDAMPLPNYLANRSFALLAQATTGAEVADLHSGMRGYRSSVIRAFAFDGEGDAIPIDTLLWPAKCGYRVVEVPIAYQERVGFSKLRKLAGTVWTFIRLAKTLKVGERASAHYEVWDGVDG